MNKSKEMFAKFLSGGRGTPSKESESHKKPPDEASSQPQSTEGFVCPICFCKFPSEVILQDHYDTIHQEPATGAAVCSACKMTLGSQKELEAHFIRHHKSPSSETKSEDINKLRQDLSEASVSLKEEQWYSEELKKEISRLQNQLSNKESSSDDTELELLKTQNKALEEGKSLMSSEISFLRKQIEESTARCDKVNSERDRLEEKAAMLNMELASLKANHDELTSSKSSLEKELATKQALVAKLESEIRQRPAADDVVVLRQELVSVQKMMDSLSLEKDKTIESLHNFSQELRDKCRSLEERNGELQSALSSAPSQDQIKCMEVQGNQALKEQEAKNGQLQKTIESLEAQLEDLQDQISGERSARQREAGQHSTQLVAEQQHVQQLLTQLKQKEETFEQQRLKLTALEERLASEKETASQCLSEKELTATRLCHEVEKLQHCVEEREQRSREQMSLLEEEKLKCDQLRSQVRATEMSFQEASRQMDQREAQLQEVLGDVQKLKETIQRQDEEKAALYEKIQQGEGTSTALEQLQTENALLLQKLEELKEAHIHAGEENMKQTDALHLQIKKLKSQLGDATDASEKHNSRMADLSCQLEASQLHSAALEKDLEMKIKEYSAAELAWAGQQSEMDRSLKSLTASLDLKSSQLEAASNTINTLKGELRESTDQSQKLQDRVSEQTQTIIALEQNLTTKAEELTNFRVESAKLKQELESKNQSLVSLEAQLLKKADDHNRVCQHLENEKNTLKKQMSDLEAKMSEQLEAKEVAQSRLQHKLAALNQEMESFGRLQVHAAQLAKQVEDMSQEGETTTALCQKLESQIQELEKEADILREKMASQQEVAAAELQQALAQHQEETRKQADECTELRSEMERLSKQLEESHGNQKQLSENLENSSQLNTSLNKKLMESEEELVRLRSSNRLLNAQKAKLGEQASQLRSSHKELELRASELEKELEAMRSSCQKDQQNYRSEIADLKETKKLLISQKHILQNSLEKVKQRLEQLVTKSNDHVLLLQGQCNSLQKEIEGQQRLLQEEREARAALKEEWVRKNAHLEAQLGIAQENATTLRQDLEAASARRDQLEKTVDDLAGDKLELEAKLENALDERRALLDRCLKRESECEKLHNSNLELRRKLDDSVSALQEIARENQTLQMELSKLLNRKWTDDSMVNNCTNCSKQFSVTVRKHHCRNCGNIFCKECSSKTAIVASSKSPVRVCNSCYTELQHT